MDSDLLQAYLLAIGGALSVVPILIVILLLGTKDGFHKALNYVLGYTGVFLVIGLVVLSLSQGIDPESGEASAVVSTIYLVLGVLFLIMAAKNIFKHPDPDAPPPKWITGLSKISPAKSFGIGAALAGLNIKNVAIYISALSIIILADQDQLTSFILFLLLVLVFCSTVIIPVVIYKTMPEKSRGMLFSMQKWLEKNNRTISIALLLIFGLIFLKKGLQ